MHISVYMFLHEGSGDVLCTYVCYCVLCTYIWGLCMWCVHAQVCLRTVCVCCVHACVLGVSIYMFTSIWCVVRILVS